MIDCCPCKRCTKKQERGQAMIHELKCKCEECLTEARGRRIAIEAFKDQQRQAALKEARERIYDGLTADEVLRSLQPSIPRPARYAPFYALLEEIKKLHDSKGSDYEGQGKPYCNLRGPEEWGVPAWVYAMTRCEEKMKRLKTFATGSTLKHEGARDSLLDIAVLSLIAVVLLEEKEQQKGGAQ